MHIKILLIDTGQLVTRLAAAILIWYNIELTNAINWTCICIYRYVYQSKRVQYRDITVVEGNLSLQYLLSQMLWQLYKTLLKWHSGSLKGTAFPDKKSWSLFQTSVAKDIICSDKCFKKSINVPFFQSASIFSFLFTHTLLSYINPFVPESDKHLFFSVLVTMGLILSRNQQKNSWWLQQTLIKH